MIVFGNWKEIEKELKNKRMKKMYNSINDWLKLELTFVFKKYEKND